MPRKNPGAVKRRHHVAITADISNAEETPNLGEGFSVPWGKRKIIAWDGEGINLRGRGKPQSYVLFGCSAETDSPLIGKRLTPGDTFNYMCNIAEQYPQAVHVAYAFNYDFNMLIQGFRWENKLDLKDKGETVIDKGWALSPSSWGYRYYVSYIPGKIFRVVRRELSTGKQVSIRIDDVFSFFAAKFIKAVEDILGDELTDEDKEIIEHGKAERGHTTWNDIEEIKHYWQCEISMMERMMEKFREVMYRAGIHLKQWYGPGAIASYLFKSKKLAQHIQNTPEVKEVHEASKRAYAGGRFERFHIGRVRGPVYGVDRNSAYPYALSNAPSLGPDHGVWEHIENPDRIDEFAVYRIRFRFRTTQPSRIRQPMPLFHRDNRGSITYPGWVDGWYWSPEARMAMEFGKHLGGIEISEGWIWQHDGTKPFKFLEEMFNERMRLGKRNIISMPYKLGPNSMYGKLAQRVGSKDKPPVAHCLPLAGWITSHCRAAVYNVMLQTPFDQLIAVETDGVYTTVPPDKMRLDFGDGLGQWDITEYEEMLYLQNGIYHRKQKGEWLSPKSRGLSMSSVPLELVTEYFQSSGPVPYRNGPSGTLQLPMKDRFTGLNAAFVGDPTTVNERHCVWFVPPKEINPGGTGKRIHISHGCKQCGNGSSFYDEAHECIVLSRSGFGSDIESAPHKLPWEDRKEYADTKLGREMAAMEADMMQLEAT